MTDQSRLLLANQQMTALRHMHMARSALRRMDETLENLLKLGAISAKEYAPAHLDAMRYSRNLKKDGGRTDRHCRRNEKGHFAEWPMNELTTE